MRIWAFASLAISVIGMIIVLVGNGLHQRTVTTAGAVICAVMVLNCGIGLLVVLLHHNTTTNKNKGSGAGE